MDKYNTYKLKVRCNNCQTNSEIEIQKGTKADEDTLDNVMIDHNGVECPHCGCYELRKVY